MSRPAPRLLIAAPASGGGKTTLACGVMRAFTKRGLRVASGKCGPDYIDPIFHREAVGAVSSVNLDLFLGDARLASALLSAQAKRVDLTILEGAMGYYDGLAGISTCASAYQVARETATPVVLLLDGRGASVSLAAQLKGFLQFRPDAHIRAVVLGRTSPTLCARLTPMLEAECGIPVLGCLPHLPDCAFESRHLGLVPASESAVFIEKLDRLAETIAETVDLNRLLALAQTAPPLSYAPSAPLRCVGSPRIAVARDAAFCFCYPETLHTLEQMGAQLVFFSPLHDQKLPERIDGLLLCGGYPELHAQTLARNLSMREQIRDAVAGGLATIAECGGFLYLGQTLADPDGQVWPMVGLLPGAGYAAGGLRRFGYATLTAKTENLLCAAGETLRVHEFHHWDSTEPGTAFSAEKPLTGVGWEAAFASDRLYAGFAHLYLAGHPSAALRFLNAAAQRGNRP